MRYELITSEGPIELPTNLCEEFDRSFHRSGFTLFYTSATKFGDIFWPLMHEDEFTIRVYDGEQLVDGAVFTVLEQPGPVTEAQFKRMRNLPEFQR